jgi:hypothetical protein
MEQLLFPVQFADDSYAEMTARFSGKILEGKALSLEI